MPPIAKPANTPGHAVITYWTSITCSRDLTAIHRWGTKSVPQGIVKSADIKVRFEPDDNRKVRMYSHLCINRKDCQFTRRCCPTGGPVQGRATARMPPPGKGPASNRSSRGRFSVRKHVDPRSVKTNRAPKKILYPFSYPSPSKGYPTRNEILAINARPKLCWRRVKISLRR